MFCKPSDLYFNGNDLSDNSRASFFLFTPFNKGNTESFVLELVKKLDMGFILAILLEDSQVYFLKISIRSGLFLVM